MPEPVQTDVAAIQAFIDRYRSEFAAYNPNEISDRFMEQFARVRDEFLVLRNKTLQRQLSEAPQYNIFNILGVTRSEVRTHSAFLCHLLTPSASHGQGVLFLRTFLEHCAQKYSQQFPNLPPFDAPRNWLVFSEHPTSFGRMDIIIQNPQEGFICVIENKVDAYEGIDQIERYGKWLEGHLETYQYKVLCFLTIQGSPSRTARTTPYIRLSYHRDITEWLEDTLPQIQAPGVRAVVHQYQAIAIHL